MPYSKLIIRKSQVFSTRSYVYLNSYTQIRERGGTMFPPRGQIGLKSNLVPRPQILSQFGPPKTNQAWRVPSTRANLAFSLLPEGKKTPPSPTCPNPLNKMEIFCKRKNLSEIWGSYRYWGPCVRPLLIIWEPFTLKHKYNLQLTEAEDQACFQ